LARCANSGVSGFITPTGSSISKMPQYTQMASIEQLPLMDNITIYVRYRDYLPITFSVILLISLLFSFFSKKNQEKRQ
jgi:apolipoprotein N-acyltransferase